MIAVVGVDPGARWTAGVLRISDEAVWGWTIGPESSPDALSKDLDDLKTLGRYIARVLGRIDESLQIAERDYPISVTRVGVELVRIPRDWIGNRKNPIPLGDWLIPRQVTTAIMGAYEGTRLVLAAGHGSRPRLEYPAELRRRRPPGWGPNEARNGERDHERAAYDIAGVAAAMA